jgi:hypothetical protein
MSRKNTKKHCVEGNTQVNHYQYHFRGVGLATISAGQILTPASPKEGCTLAAPVRPAD